jgi:3-oxoadipate enol-lactonase
MLPECRPPVISTGRALLKWSAIARLERLKAKALVIAAENDFTPLEEKRALAARLGADLMMVRGSRHGTPFDSVRATNEEELAFSLAKRALRVRGVRTLVDSSVEAT